MKSKNSSDCNTPLFSDEEIKKLTASTTYTEEQLRKLFEACQDYTKEELIRLVEAAYIPKQRQPIRVDQEHDVIYFAVEEDEVKELDNSPKQSASQPPNSGEALGEFPDMETGFSYTGRGTFERPMQRIEDDIPPGYKRMMMWSKKREAFCLRTVPENTPELTSEEIERYSHINPK